MTMLREPDVRATGRTTFIVEWVAGVLGALATAVGLWMYHGPDDGMLRLFGWEWDVAALSEAWPFGLIILGALALFAVFSRVSTHRRDELEGGAGTYALLAILALALAAVYTLIWVL
ncbi:MAG: hypothetical protein OEX04_16280 [Acidimicrobiia bacterium]|nr:hypothetical protein [Acidimicrobiia bacterium]MDH4309025.1 hypothetical protein [Acidimicrobiia bacterium]MDH5293559.1 hypothetical protein [Acidimicrobiia bacterium]